MRRLTVGDKVVYKQGTEEDFEKMGVLLGMAVEPPVKDGSIGVILQDEKNKQPYLVKFENRATWWCMESEVTAVEESEMGGLDMTQFKVGDRVVYNQYKRWGVGVVRQVDTPADGLYTVEFLVSERGFHHDCGGVISTKTGYWCDENTLTLVDAPPLPSDMVNHPDHYTAGGIETIDFIRAKLTPEAFQGYCMGNVMKYTARYNLKNGLEDLKKAQVYLQWAIESMEGEGV